MADPTLQLVKGLLLRGWPEHKRQCPVPAKPFWTVRNDLSEVDGLLLYGERLVVPMSLRQEVMAGVHDGHFGEVKSVQRAKSAVYWPGCDDQIRNMVASCSICQENRHRNPAQPLYPVKLPIHPFQMVSADLFKFDGVNYLLVMDSYSKWPYAVRMNSTTASAVIAELGRIFSDFGVPEEFETDNGTQLECAEILEFCKMHRIRHVTSSPEYAQANGLVERHIQTVKRVILKMFRDGKTLFDALAALRSTPVSAALPSPAVLLQGRNLRGKLPFLPTRLQPQLVPAQVVQNVLQQRQARASFNHGRSPDARGSSLAVGQRVRAYVLGRWLPGTVESVCSEPHSYVIRLLDGRAFRRTRRAINVDRSTSPQGAGSHLSLPALPSGLSSDLIGGGRRSANPDPPPPVPPMPPITVGAGSTPGVMSPAVSSPHRAPVRGPVGALQQAGVLDRGRVVTRSTAAAIRVPAPSSPVPIPSEATTEGTRSGRSYLKR